MLSRLQPLPRLPARTSAPSRGFRRPHRSRAQPCHPGCVGTGICFRDDNTVEFRQRALLKSTNWSDYATAVYAGPRLVSNGTVAVYPRAEGFRDGGLFRKAHRSAVGVTRYNKLLLVS